MTAMLPTAREQPPNKAELPNALQDLSPARRIEAHRRGLQDQQLALARRNCRRPDAHARGAAMTLAEPIVVAEFWANRRGEAVRVQLREYEGQALIDVRRYYTGAEGKLLPTQKGLSLVVRRLPDLAAAIGKALNTARELKLIPTMED
jgi:Transcriptional Coactivator p15 (PC4)